MNKFAAINLKKRIEAKADAENLTGNDREVFCFVAASEVGFVSLMKRFDAMGIGELAFAMKRLMDRGLLHMMHSSDRYYTSAV